MGLAACAEAGLRLLNGARELGRGEQAIHETLRRRCRPLSALKWGAVV